MLLPALALQRCLYVRVPGHASIQHIRLAGDLAHITFDFEPTNSSQALPATDLGQSLKFFGWKTPTVAAAIDQGVSEGQVLEMERYDLYDPHGNQGCKEHVYDAPSFVYV